MFLILGPLIEGKYFPVVDDTNITYVQRTNKFTRIIFDATKERDCRFIELSALAGSGKRFQKAKVVFEDEEDGVAATRPKGRQVFGPWVVTPSAEEIIIVVHHDCHPLWVTVTPLVYLKKSP